MVLGPQGPGRVSRRRVNRKTVRNDCLFLCSLIVKIKSYVQLTTFCIKTNFKLIIDTITSPILRKKMRDYKIKKDL